MSKKSSKLLRRTPLQTITLVPITDPGEWAERERRMRNAIRVVEGEATADGGLELYQGLPAAGRLEALRLLVKELSADERQELLARLPPKTAQRARAQSGTE